MLKKYFLGLTIVVTLLTGVSNFVFAQTEPDLSSQIAQKSGYGAANSTTLSETVGKVIKIALGLLGVIFLLLTVYAGYLWMTAAGNDEQVTKATGILKMAVMGLIIILSAYSLTYFILAKVFESTR